jgi:membrane-associated protease RseP (regulator of RpoE activity)
LTEPSGEANTRDFKAEQRRSVLLFFATFACVYLVYGFQWTDGNPFTDPQTAWAATKFSVALMAILLSHEMAHYWVAKAHGFALSLPYFLPFPAAFGTFGAIIRLRSLPKSRTALLEMGAAGPIAGFAVALVAIAAGLPGTIEHPVPELVWDPAILDALRAPVLSPTTFDVWLTKIAEWTGAAVGPTELPLMILANPPIMDLLGEWVLGAPPSRYASLDPLATAGWVGCLLTAINLIPIGQLDGGHILNAIAPRFAPWVSKALIGVALMAGVVWTGWAFWAVLLCVLGAWESLPVPGKPPLTMRAKAITGVTVVAFWLSFMPSPIEIEGFELADLNWITADGEPISAEIHQELKAALLERLDPEHPER